MMYYIKQRLQKQVFLLGDIFSFYKEYICLFDTKNLNTRSKYLLNIAKLLQILLLVHCIPIFVQSYNVHSPILQLILFVNTRTTNDQSIEFLIRDIKVKKSNNDRIHRLLFVYFIKKKSFKPLTTNYFASVIYPKKKNKN